MRIIHLALIVLILYGCRESKADKKTVESPLALEVKRETLRSWNAYVDYAWPHDNLLPISKSYKDWYEQPLYISPIDAYSTLKVMGLEDEAKRIEQFAMDSLNFDHDMKVKVFEVNIRILGGLLAIYEWSGNENVLAKAKEFGDRILPAFDSPTGLPYFWINLKTGEPSGEVICVAEAGSYLIEFGMLSYYTGEAIYYQAAKRSSKYVFDNYSDIGLPGRDVNVMSGEWTVRRSMVGAYVDSYYEYLYKGYKLFGDIELKTMWEKSIPPLHRYLRDVRDGKAWYAKANMDTGEIEKYEVLLWDAYFPALLALSGDLDRAQEAQKSWEYLWDKNGLIPSVYDYEKDSILNAYYQLNPEVIVSNYYLWYYTGDSTYSYRAEKYFNDIKKYCKDEVAYHHIANVITKEKDDQMATFFIAETMKYLYLTFNNTSDVNPDNFVFNTEAHPFDRRKLDPGIVKSSLDL